MGRPDPVVVDHAVPGRGGEVAGKQGARTFPENRHRQWGHRAPRGPLENHQSNCSAADTHPLEPVDGTDSCTQLVQIGQRDEGLPPGAWDDAQVEVRHQQDQRERGAQTRDGPHHEKDQRIAQQPVDQDVARACVCPTALHREARLQVQKRRLVGPHRLSAAPGRDEKNRHRATHGCDGS